MRFRVGRRRRWSVQEKGRIVAESHAPGAVTSEVARRQCQRNIELIWLTGQLAPDFKTAWPTAARGHRVGNFATQYNRTTDGRFGRVGSRRGPGFE
jgi:hypothetical protein